MGAADPGRHANQHGPDNNVLANEFARTFFNDYNLRIDHQFSTAFKLYGSFTQNDISGYERPIQYQAGPAGRSMTYQGNYSSEPDFEYLARLYMGDLSVELINDSRAGYFRRRTRNFVAVFRRGLALQARHSERRQRADACVYCRGADQLTRCTT